MMIHKRRKDLFLIDLDLDRKGFRKFIASWLYRSGNLNILIDPGPFSTILVLKKALESLGITKLDYILLTHIHIDHAGGTGKLLEYFPDTPILCHQKGIPHLINPDKLWESTKQVLGPMAGIYGKIIPVPEKNIFFHNFIQFPNHRVEVFKTPGHASHHLSFKIEDLLFAGEALGVTIPEKSNTYLRLATPPVFIYEVYRKSIEFLHNLDNCQVCFGHYDLKANSQELAESAQHQLELWMEVSEKKLNSENIYNKDNLLCALLMQDPNLRIFADLPPDIQNRELAFITNSLAGIKGYLERKRKEDTITVS